MSAEEVKVEEKLRKIVETGNPASVTYKDQKLYISKKKIEEIKKLVSEVETDGEEKEGGFLPLLALLPAIFGGIAAAGGVAGGVATAVAKAKEGQLADAMKAKVQSAGKSGFRLDPYNGRGITDYLRTHLKTTELDKTEKKKLKTVLKKLGKGDIEVEFTGNGIYLSPYQKPED